MASVKRHAVYTDCLENLTTEFLIVYTTQVQGCALIGIVSFAIASTVHCHIHVCC